MTILSKLFGSKKQDESEDLLRGALTIISEYGEVLEQTSNMVSGVPESKLPYSKEVIKNSILMWSASLQNKSFRELVKKEYSELTDRILSEEFYDSLEVGYIELAKFIPDQEAEFCAELQQLLINQQLYDETKPIGDFSNWSNELKEKFENFIHEVKTRQDDFDKFTKIQKRIAEESGKLLNKLKNLER